MKKVKVLNQESTLYKPGEITELYTLEEVLSTKGLKTFNNRQDLVKFYKGCSNNIGFVGFVKHKSHKDCDGFRRFIEMYEDDVEFIEENTVQNNTIYFAKVDSTKNTIIPTKREEDGAFDIYANFDDDYIIIEPHKTVKIPTNLAIAFSDDYVLILKERGSTGVIGLGQRSGVGDSGYRGEYFVPITNHNDVPIMIYKNDSDFSIMQYNYDNDFIAYPYEKAICQGVLLPIPKVKSKEISYEELLKFESERGLGALGSSGK